MAIAQLGERQTEVHFGCLSGGHVFNPHLAQNVSPVNGEEFLFAFVDGFLLDYSIVVGRSIVWLELGDACAGSWQCFL